MTEQHETPGLQTRRTEALAPRDAAPGSPHLCQFNVAWMRRPYSDPVWDSWKTHLVPRLHARARAAPGFVALYDGQETAQGYLVPYPREPLVMGNLSAWDNATYLRAFVFDDPAHLAAMKVRDRWFRPPAIRPYSVYYWSPVLDLVEAVGRLNHLREFGPTPLAFGEHQLIRL